MIENQEVERHIPGPDKPVRVVDNEPDSPAAISIPFKSLPTAKDIAALSIIKVNSGVYSIGDGVDAAGVYSFTQETLSTWKAWHNLEQKLKAACKQANKKLSRGDVALLEELSAVNAGAKSGWNELRQALTQAQLI